MQRKVSVLTFEGVMINLTFSSVHPDISKYGDAALDMGVKSILKRFSKFTLNIFSAVLKLYDGSHRQRSNFALVTLESSCPSSTRAGSASGLISTVKQSLPLIPPLQTSMVLSSFQRFYRSFLNS